MFDARCVFHKRLKGTITQQIMLNSSILKDFVGIKLVMIRHNSHVMLKLELKLGTVNHTYLDKSGAFSINLLSQ